MSGAPALLAFLAACGAPSSTARYRAGRLEPASWSADDWRAQLAEERQDFLPRVPERIRGRLEQDHAIFELELRAGSLRSLDLLAEHTAIEEMLVRSMLTRDDRAGARIYLDNHATTPVDPRIAEAVCRCMTRDFGNPHSVHHCYGDDAGALCERSRQHIADLVDADPADVHFVSGATEAIRVGLDHAIRSIARAKGRPAHVATLPVEHRAVLTALEDARAAGRARISGIRVDEQGRLDWASFASLLPTIDLVCAMGANNEIGNVYPLEVLAGVCGKRGIAVFTDATQAVGKVPVRARRWGIDLLTLTAHKIYGPKGCGALVLRGPLASGFEPPSGTPATPGIVGLGEACRLRALEMAEDEATIGARRDWLEQRLLDAGIDAVVNGDRAHRLAGSLHVSLPVLNEVLLSVLHDRIALSTGAACASAKGARSHVLDAMGISEARKRGAVRIGLGKFNSDDEVADAANAIVSTVRELLRA